MSRRAAIAMACAGALAGCASPPASDRTSGAGTEFPNVVLISIDTLRSDRLPAYGYTGVETPAIDRLAADGVLFERAFTHVNVTLPAHASLFTGLLPPQHGVRDNAGYRLDEAVPTLAETLGRRGYATGGFVSSYVLRAGTGIGRGFDVYDDGVRFMTGRDLGELQRPGPETLAAASDWLGDAAGSPFFLFLHLYEPHAPYNPPAPFAERYDDSYDGEIAAADAVVGELLRRLEELGLYRDALIILLSDHGEGLMDHGEMDHLILIYREVLQVPLIVKLPGGARAGERVATNAQLADVAPTVHSLLGLEHAPELPGGNLLELQERSRGAAPRQIVSESVYPRIHFGWSDLASVVEDDLHFIESPDPELFRLSVDPGELNNVIQEERAAARRMRAALEEIDRSLTSPAEDDPEIRRRLESLGYLSGGARAGDGPLPDPKSRIGIVEELARSARWAAGGELAEAESVLRTVLETEPQLVLAWHELGEILERRGHPGAALDAYRQAFEASGGDAGASGVKVAEILLRMGRVVEAREHALAVADRSPLAPQVLAEAALVEGDLEAAAEHLARALAERGPRVAPLIVRTRLLNAQGRFEEALVQSEEALAEFGDREDRPLLARLHLHRGTAFGTLGRAEEAERAYREAIALDRELLGAYSSLAFLFATRGRAAEAGRTLQEMVTVNPAPASYAEAVRTLRAMRDERSAEAVLAEALRRWPDSDALRRIDGSM
ncbi:MAG: sulfatase-like hydrolase/transferase [Acidobacteria bacterium]|nr:sulfatase-like hydrolase/transferase [Acidobacteriota bacterium]